MFLSSENRPEIRWKGYPASPRLLGAVRNLTSADWLELAPEGKPGDQPPVRHIGPIASGDKLIAVEEVLARLRAHWPELIGVEMEAAGVVAASFQAAKPPEFFMVRGVSDLADEEKNSAHVRRWRPYACDIAASYTVALLKSGPIVLQTDRLPLHTDLAPANEVLRQPITVLMNELALVGKTAEHNRQLALDDTPKPVLKMSIDEMKTAVTSLDTNEMLVQTVQEYLIQAASINSLVDRYNDLILSGTGLDPLQMGVRGSSRGSWIIEQIVRESEQVLSVLERMRACLQEELG